MIERARARAELHAYYRRRFGTVDVEGGGGLAGADDEGPLLRVFQPLDAIELDDHGGPLPLWQPFAPDGGVGADGRPHADTVRLQPRAAPLLAQLERPRARPALLIGPAGAGKSCFLRWCALRGSADPRFLGIDDTLPLFVALADLGSAVVDGATLLAIARAELRAAGLTIADAIEPAAGAGRVVFLLDGLDQAGAAAGAVAAAIAELARTYPAARVLVTARPAALAGLTLAADRLHLAGLGDDAIAALLTAWCADQPHLVEQVLTDERLRDLAARPLLATFIARVHRAGGAVPTTRVELCQRVAGLGDGPRHRLLDELAAAHALVDRRGLEELVGVADRAFAAADHEVVRFGLAIVGTVHDDAPRLAAALDLVLAAAATARATPGARVPELLGALLVDDPGLTPAQAAAICAELVPAWWFDGAAGEHGELAGLVLIDQILAGPWQRELARALIQRYRPGWGDPRDHRGDLRTRLVPMGVLRRLGCPIPLLLCEALVAEMARAPTPARGSGGFVPLAQIEPPDDAATPAFVAFALRVAGVTALLRVGAGHLFFAAVASDSPVGPPWVVLEDAAGARLIGRRLGWLRADAPIERTGPIHLAVVDHPDPALLANVLAAWRELAERYPGGPPPPATVEDALARYGPHTLTAIN